MSVADCTSVSLADGTFLPAMEVYPGKEVLSFLPTKKPGHARVLDRTVESHSDAISLLLSNGQKLTGSRDQMIACHRGRNVIFRPLADVELGDRLRGERAGVPVVVTVIGLSIDLNREVRLVGLQIDHDRNYVAAGVSCR